MILIFNHAAKNGDWKRLLVPQDKNGMSCGLDNGLPGKNYEGCKQLYFADPITDPKDRRCVSECPTGAGDIVCDWCANCHTSVFRFVRCSYCPECS